MSLLQRSPYGGDPVFGSLFRFLDDFDSYSRGSLGTNKHDDRHVRQQFFNPRFDIRETEKTYEVDGELPGLDRKDIIIEFTDPQTIVVRGHSEHTYSAGTPPKGLIEGTQTSGTIVRNGEDTRQKEDGSNTKERFWCQERSVGEFHRTFTFPSPIENSNVSASLNNGILHITIPKAVNHASRRITVD